MSVPWLRQAGDVCHACSNLSKSRKESSISASSSTSWNNAGFKYASVRSFVFVFVPAVLTVDADAAAAAAARVTGCSNAGDGLDLPTEAVSCDHANGGEFDLGCVVSLSDGLFPIAMASLPR